MVRGGESGDGNAEGGRGVGYGDEKLRAEAQMRWNRMRVCEPFTKTKLLINFLL